MDSNKQAEDTANEIKELHNNIRHITQLAMNWFAFFVTVNYLTMGWLAKGTGNENIRAPGNESINVDMVQIVACVFIVQNVLGVFGLIGVLWAATKMKNQISTVEKNSQKEESQSEIIPAPLYILIGVCLMVVLAFLIHAWWRISRL